MAWFTFCIYLILLVGFVVYTMSLTKTIMELSTPTEEKYWMWDAIRTTVFFSSIAIYVVGVPFIYEFPWGNTFFTVEDGMLVEHTSGMPENPFGPDRTFSPQRALYGEIEGFEVVGGTVASFEMFCSFFIVNPQKHFEFFGVDEKSGWGGFFGPRAIIRGEGEKEVALAYGEVREDFARALMENDAPTNKDASDGSLSRYLEELIMTNLDKKLEKFGFRTTCEVRWVKVF